MVVLFFCTAGLFQTGAYAQVQKSGDIRGYVYGIIDRLPGAEENDYQTPSVEERSAWKELINHLLNRDFQTAASLAADLKYELVDFTDGETHYYILERKEPAGPWWGTYVFNPDGCRKIVIQSPHPKYDMNTGKEGVYVFSHANALFFCLSGTHRCNASSFSDCSGSTSVCSGSSEPYRISDPAHNVNSIFQATTEELHAFDSTLVFIQLHGFAKRTNDPYVIMSNCTRITPDPDFTVKLKDNLAAEDPTLTFKIGHIDLSWNRLLAFTNVQGRFLGHSPDPCLEDADTTFGNFIHIEQEKSRLREDSTKWDKMSRAVINTFSCRPAGIHPTSPPAWISVYPNPTDGNIHLDLGRQEECVTLTLLTVTGKEILRKKYRNIRKPALTIPGPVAFYLIEVTTPHDPPILLKILKK